MSAKVLSSLGEKIVLTFVNFGFLLRRVQMRRLREDGRENLLICMEVGYRKMGSLGLEEQRLCLRRCSKGESRWKIYEKKYMADGLK